MREEDVLENGEEMGNGEEKEQGKCHEQDYQEVPGNTKCLPQRLVWTTVSKVRVRVMEMAAVMNLLGILQSGEHISLGLAHCEAGVRFLDADGPFLCYGCTLPLFLDSEK